MRRAVQDRFRSRLGLLAFAIVGLLVVCDPQDLLGWLVVPLAASAIVLTAPTEPNELI